jgi:hypothetical protein
MSYDFDIQKIVVYLNKFKGHLPVLYQWKPNLAKLIELKVLTSAKAADLNQLTSFEREIEMKQLIGKQLNIWQKSNNPSFKTLCLWIIKDWGGIKASKDEETFNCIKNFLSCPSPSFNRISSTSKVGSFLYPEKFVIYDARVAYSLNWIILSQDAGKFYFPIPDGRNSRMTALDLAVLIRLKNIAFYQSTIPADIQSRQFIKRCDKSIFIPEKIAYTEFCRVIKMVNDNIWKDDKEKTEKLYYTEMLLFAIADRQIFQDITHSVSLNLINTN